MEKYITVKDLEMVSLEAKNEFNYNPDAIVYVKSDALVEVGKGWKAIKLDGLMVAIPIK